MDAIKSAIKSLENFPKKKNSKILNRDVEDAIAQLSSTIRLFELSAPSASTFTRLAELLRGRLLPLYRSSLLPALEYAAAVFRFIHQNIILPALESREQKYMWENLLASLLSGILDFLDEPAPANSRHDENVASAVFPLLCPLFFQQAGQAIDFDGNLSSVVYQLLMTIVELHACNVSKLRDHDIGSKRLGFTISQTKEYLAMESLLELFAVLVPPVKGGRAKRTQFIREVFDLSIFSCSGRIIQCLESIANPDWSITASEIMNTLAESDISFPQPLDVSNLAVNDLQMRRTSSFYIDKFKFIANLDKDGKIETFHLPFSTVRKITASPSTNGEVQIIVKISEPSILGDKPIGMVSAGEMSVSWTLKQIHMSKFGKALKSRNLNAEVSASKKLSKGAEIKLDFDSSKQASLMLDKVQSLSQLWAFDALPKVGGQMHVPVTSPLAPQSARRASANSVPTVTANVEPLKDATRESRQPYNKVMGSMDQYSDDEVPQPKSRVAKSKRRIITISDDEDQDAPPTSAKHHQLASDVKSASPIDVEKFPGSPQTKLERLTYKLEKVLAPVKPTESLHPISKPAKDNIKRQHKDDDRDDVDRQSVKKSKKRPAQAIEDDREEKHPAKRLRSEPVNHSPVAPTRPYQRKKYGRKGRTSSPTLADSPPIDFNEVPQAEAPKPVKEASKSRASAMKGKNGKPVPKAKRAPVKKADVRDQEVKGRVHPVKNDPDITLINPSDTVLKSPTKNVKIQEEAKIHRRSARVASTLASTKADLKKSEQNISKKPKKASWEEKDFREKMSNPIADSSGPIEEDAAKPSDRSDSVTVTKHEVLEEEILFFNDNNGPYSEAFTEFLEPLKNGTSSSDGPSEPTSKGIIIDLTQDDSPKPHRATKQVPTGRSRHITQNLPTSKNEKIEVPAKTGSRRSSSMIQMRRIERVSSPPLIPREVRAVDDLLPSRKDIKMPAVKVERMPSPPPANVEEQYENQLDVNHSLRQFDNTRRTWSRDPTDRQRFTDSPRLPKLEEVQGKAHPSVSFALPRFDSTRSTWPEDHSRTRGSEAADAKRSRDRSENKGSLRQPQQRPKRAPLEPEPEEQPMERIIDILNQINEAVIHKVRHRFDDVTEGLHAGQRTILEGTADVLRDMCHTSVRYFNDMVDLEAEYTAHRAKITHGLYDFRKSTEQVSQCFKDIVVDHSRRSLSNKFPTTLFENVPNIITNPALRL